MEIKQELRTVYVRRICDHCGKGEMVRENPREALFSSPPQYKHYCKVCGYRENYHVSYPAIGFEYTDDSNVIHVLSPSEKRGVIEDFQYEE